MNEHFTNAYIFYFKASLRQFEKDDFPLSCFFTWKRLALKSQLFAPVDWKHKLQSMSCSHALFTNKKGKVPGQQKVP